MSTWSFVAVARWATVLGWGVVCPRLVLGQDASAAAQVLFEQGRDLLRNGQADEACPKLAESQRLDPAIGTLLALSICSEAQGKLVSAWIGFSEVAARAAKEGQVERESHARKRVAELRPRLSTLELRLPPEVAAYPGLEVRRNGVLMGKGVWNVPVPVDGGTHHIEVSAENRETWRRDVSVADERDKVVEVLPALARVLQDNGAPVSETDARAPQLLTSDVAREQGASSGGAAGLRWTGVAMAGAGVATLLVGGGFLWRSYELKLDGQQQCTGNTCDAVTKAKEDAWVYGNWATGFGIGGGALLLGGAALYLLNGEPEATTVGPVNVTWGPRGFWLGVTGNL